MEWLGLSAASPPAERSGGFASLRPQPPRPNLTMKRLNCRKTLALGIVGQGGTVQS